MDTHEQFHRDGETDRTPTGHARLSRTATRNGGADGYSVATKDGGGRESYDAETEWYFVVDHSSYGDGVAPGETADGLGPFVDIQVIDKPVAL